MNLPRQRQAPVECICGAPIHQVNRQLGPVYVHAAGSEWCGSAGDPLVQRAEPAGIEVAS